MTYPIRGGSALWSVQRAVYTTLQTSSELLTILKGGIFDGEPPEDERVQLPYLVIGESTEAPADRLTTTGSELTVLFHVFSNYSGAQEIKVISDLVAKLFNHRSFPIDGWTLNHCRLEFAEMIFEQDGIRHGLLRYRMRVQPNA